MAKGYRFIVLLALERLGGFVMAYIVRTSVDVLHNPRFEADELDLKNPANLTGGRPITARGLPTEVRQISDHKYIPDILTIFGLWVVSEEFRRVVEALEPRVHQYLPFKLFRKNGEPVGKQYYFLNICRQADAIDMELSDTYWTEDPFTDEPMELLRVDGKVVVRKERIAGLHLWRGTGGYQTRVFFSDALMDAVLEAKLPAIVGTPVEEV